MCPEIFLDSAALGEGPQGYTASLPSPAFSIVRSGRLAKGASIQVNGPAPWRDDAAFWLCPAAAAKLKPTAPFLCAALACGLRAARWASRAKQNDPTSGSADGIAAAPAQCGPRGAVRVGFAPTPFLQRCGSGIFLDTLQALGARSSPCGPCAGNGRECRKSDLGRRPEAARTPDLPSAGRVLVLCAVRSPNPQPYGYRSCSVRNNSGGDQRLTEGERDAHSFCGCGRADGSRPLYFEAPRSGHVMGRRAR